MTSTREQFIRTTCQLLESQGYHGTGMAQIVEESGAPKGSLYYHFPGGKEELAEKAVELAGRSTADVIRGNLREDLPLPEALRRYVRGIADRVKESGYQSGSPLTATAMETVHGSERLNRACREAFQRIQKAFEEKLLEAEVPPHQAGQLAVFLVSAVEGGIILSRTHHSPEPLQKVADQLDEFFQAYEDQE